MFKQILPLFGRRQSTLQPSPFNLRLFSHAPELPAISCMKNRILPDPQEVDGQQKREGRSLTTLLPPHIQSRAEGARAAIIETCLDKKPLLPDFTAVPSFARGPGPERAFLAVLTRSLKAEKILEIGSTLDGLPMLTMALARSLPSHGQIDTIIFSQLFALVAQKTFPLSDSHPMPIIHVGDPVKLLQDPKGPFSHPLGTAEGLPIDQRGYDVCLMKAYGQDYRRHWEECLRLTRKGGSIIVIGDEFLLRSGSWKELRQDIKKWKNGLGAIYDWIGRDKATTVVMSEPILKVKGSHGTHFAIAVKL